MPFKLKIKTVDGSELPDPGQVTIREQLGQPRTFTITYSEDICEGDYQLLKNPAFNPLKEIAISVVTDWGEMYLLKGVVQGQQISIKYGGQGSQLQITGSDNLVKLGWETKKKSWEGEKWAKVLTAGNIEQIFKNEQHEFDQFSIFKNAGTHESGPEAPTQNGQDETEKVHLHFKEQVVQREDDLSFLQRLARQKGMYVWLSYDEGGKEVVHFDQLPLQETPGLELSIAGEDHNIGECEINWDAGRPTSIQQKQIDRRNHQVNPRRTGEAPQPKLGDVTLKCLTSGIISAVLPGMASDTEDMGDRNGAALNEAEWFIKASCSTTFEQLCKQGAPKIVHAHETVQLKGVGSRHEGTYLVAGVTHTIDAESYKLQIELQRNAWSASSWEKVICNVTEAIFEEAESK
ncbi:MAG: hypothetical protein KIPDCIKN_00457 [Haliscomenobacter sp.]|nr:hypothetical protein [Haliscomenobacter sp.]